MFTDERKYAQEIANRLELILGGNYSVNIQNVTKQGGARIGLAILKNGENIQAMLYPKVLNKNDDLDTYVKQLAEDAVQALDKENISSLGFFPFNKEVWLKKLSVVLLNLRYEKEYLKGKVYREYFGDLALVPIVKGNDCHIAVTTELLTSLEKDADEVIDLGLDHFFAEEYCKMFLDELLAIIDPENYANIPSDSLLDGIPPLLFISNVSRCFGAPCMLDSKLLKDIEKELGGSFYVLPSSVHEILCLKVLDEMSVSYLQWMIRCVNKEHVVMKERLSEFVYLFRDGKLQRMEDDHI